ncbi:hypothetical protein A0J48_012505 [Sphaerospermopsis aphanizomenoides BCCUSP55]|uniref:hypothetical protein n=1 Tax=Sphaerospermopsis aphanizomenoides TaxID=459663 RepID=UPI000AA3630E|nr:hypothetical protein [Sphaerospermopsis aphanizomenoides]MBK1988351.1 hypothetical protein [Sphaerospermopsis aphanizomenoides BCCUSP55]
MINHFNFKSLAFYGVAIASVLILFKTVTAYGENHLRATTPINNRYRLNLATNLANCKQTNTLVLNIQQSGIYLNAALFPLTTTNTDTEQQLPLSGILKNQQLQLSGNIDSSIFCQTPASQTKQIQPITIQMSQMNTDKIPGQIKLDQNSTILEFTTLPQTDQKANPKSQSH